MYISPNDITAFEEQDIETVLADELADSEDRYEPTSHPTAVLLAGQPGAGKTELASAMSGMLDYNDPGETSLNNLAECAGKLYAVAAYNIASEREL